jgi:hypothetical protein
MRSTFFDEFMRSAKEAPRIFFAPLNGAIKEVRAEFRRAGEQSAHPRSKSESVKD